MTKIENTSEKKPSQREVRRKKLIELSTAARKIRDKEGRECTLNEIIIERFYMDEENTEFHLMRDWNEKGYKVKKGSKSFVIWGKKRTGKAAPTETKEEEEYKFFPMAYLFSNAQVKER